MKSRNQTRAKMNTLEVGGSGIKKNFFLFHYPLLEAKPFNDNVNLASNPAPPGSLSYWVARRPSTIRIALRGGILT